MDIRSLHKEGHSIKAIARMDTFDFHEQPSIDKRLIDELATGRFLHEGRNVVFLGPPGVGKRLGRPRVSVDDARIARLRAQGRSIREIADELGYSRSLVHKTLANGESRSVASAGVRN